MPLARIRSLPKAELHLHLEGTLEAELVFELAERNGLRPPAADVEALRDRLQFTDLRSFLDLYYDNLAVLRTAEDFADLTAAYLRRAATAGVRHAEVFFDPQAHSGRGVALEAVVEGIAPVLGDPSFGVDARLIACFLRDRSAEEADETLDALVATGVDLLGVGLDSAEVGHPPSKFTEVFARAGALGLRRYAHAGEEGPPDYITEALDLLGVERIDHGVRCLEDPALVRRLVAERVALTVCPLSNVALGVVDRIEDHPLPRLLDAGVVACVNSDDPAYFGGYLDDNLAALETGLGFDDAGLALVARHSVEASVLDAGSRRALLGAIDAWEVAGVAGRTA